MPPWTPVAGNVSLTKLTHKQKDSMLRALLMVGGLLAAVASTAGARELTWRKDIQPLVAARCVSCHGPSAPDYMEWGLLDEKRRLQTGMRMDTYLHFLGFVVWPDAGAQVRRLDDGKVSGGKPGNMYVYLGDNDAERAKNLKLIKDWMGEDAWNPNRWRARGDVSAVTKEQLEKIKAKY